jgi:hypothetical protein
MVYALLMILVLLAFAAMWRGNGVSALALFVVTAAFLLVHVVADMTTPLTLSF